jgi:hypothetical protein
VNVRTTLAAAVVLGPLAAVAVGAPSATPPDRVLSHLRDPRIVEASGAAIGIRSPHILYTHNDSGDSARFFAVDLHTGATVASHAVPAHAVDWEDIAVARDAHRHSAVWLADIGDNSAVRHEVDIYRVSEPAVAAGDHVTAAPAVWRLRYPDVAHDAETLLVRPGGQAYVVTKSLADGARVYAVPAAPDPSRVQTMRYVRRLPISLATGGAVSHDGSRLVIRSYFDADLWHLRGSIARTLAAKPTYLSLPAQRQGEGVAFDGASLVLTSEGLGAPVLTVALPTTPVGQPTTPPSPRPTSGPVGHGGTGTGAVVTTVIAAFLALAAMAVIIRARRIARPPD